MQLQHIVVLIPGCRTHSAFLCGSQFPAVEAASGSGGTATTKSMVLSKNDDNLIRLVNLQPIPKFFFWPGSLSQIWREMMGNVEQEWKGSEAILWQSQHLATQLQTRRFGLQPGHLPFAMPSMSCNFVTSSSGSLPPKDTDWYFLRCHGALRATGLRWVE